MPLESVAAGDNGQDILDKLARRGWPRLRLPCGHITQRSPDAVERRGQYVCGTCMALTGEWVEGRLDPAWVVVPEPVVEAPPPAHARLTPQRVALSMVHLRSLIEQEGSVSRARYDQTRPPGAAAATSLMDHGGKGGSWSDLVIRNGGEDGLSAYRRRRSRQEVSNSLALIAEMAAREGRVPGAREYEIERHGQMTVLRSTTLIKRLGLTTWPEVCTEALRLAQREVA